jgi:hypothetical protein
MFEFADGVFDTAKGKAFGSERGDMGAVSRKYHTPRFLAERHPQFMPTFERAVTFEHERHQLAEELHRTMQPYFALPAKLRKKLDNKLIQARYRRTDDLDWAGFSDEQKAEAEPAFKGVRKAMHRAFEEMENLAVDLASDGRVTDAAAIASLEDAHRLVRETGLEDKMAERQAKRLWDVLTELRRTNKQGYVPFTRFGNWRFGFADTKDDSTSVWEHRTNTIAAHERWRKFKRTHSKKLNNPRYRFRGPHEITKHLPMKGVMEGLGGFEFSILMQIAHLSPDSPGMNKDDRMKSLQEILESGGMTAEDAEAAVNSAENKGLFKGSEGLPFSEQVRLLQTHIKRAGFRSHFTHAKEVRGFEGNLERPFADYIMGISNHIAKRRFIRDAQKLTEAIPAHKGRLKQYAQEYVQYLASPPEEWGWVRGLLFHAYLGNLPFGLNVRAPLVNMSQVWLMTYPWLAQYAGDARATAEINRAYKDVMLTVGPVRREGRRVLVDFDKLPEDVRADAKASIADGTLQSQMLDELAGLARAKTKTGKLAHKVSGGFFQAAEEINRVVTFVAAHRIYQRKREKALTPARKKGTGQRHGIFLAEFDSPLAFAEDTVNKTQLEYGRYNRPELFRGRKSVLFVFKSFMVGNLELQQRLWNSWVDANETALTGGYSGGRPPQTPGGPPQSPPSGGSGDGNDGPPPYDPINPGGRPRQKAWWKKTAWGRMLFLQFMASGFKGLWYMGEFLAAAGIVWKLTHHGEVLDFEQVTRDWLQEHAGERLGDAVMYGAPQVYDWAPDLHGSMSMGEPLGVTRFAETGKLTDLAPVFAFPGRVGPAALELLGGGETWAEDIKNALVSFGGSGGFPALAKAEQAAREGIRTRPTTTHPKGKRLPLPGGREDLTPFELVEMAVGFNPVSVSKARRQERSIQLTGIAKAGPKSYFLQRLKRAFLDDDEKVFDRIVDEEIPKWNSDRMLWIGSPREGTYREISVALRKRSQIPERLRGNVDITWDDIVSVLKTEAEDPEQRQLKGVRRSVRPHVEELQDRYRGEPPDPEEVFGVAP